MEPYEHKILIHQPEVVTSSFMAEDEEDAEELFVTAKDRLLHVSHWASYYPNESIGFQLIDHHNHAVERSVRKGDFIEVTNKGIVCWLKVTAVIYDDFPDQNMESFSVEAWVTAPITEQDDATYMHSPSLFRIARDGRELLAIFHGDKYSDTIDNASLGNICWKEWGKAMLDFSMVK